MGVPKLYPEPQPGENFSFEYGPAIPKTKRRRTVALSGQNQTIYAHLRNGGKLTTLIAMLPPFNCCRTSERIREIESYLGFKLVHKRIKVGKKHVTEYSWPHDR